MAENNNKPQVRVASIEVELGMSVEELLRHLSKGGGNSVVIGIK